MNHKKAVVSAIIAIALSASVAQAKEPTDIETDQTCQRFGKIVPVAEFGDKVKLPNLVLKIQAGASRHNDCSIGFYQKKAGSNDLGFPEFSIVVAQYRNAPETYAEFKSVHTMMSSIPLDSLTDKQVSGIRDGSYHSAAEHNINLVTSKNDFVRGMMHKGADKKAFLDILNTVVPRLNSADFDKYRSR
jgi:hypothetical protein